ncbi:MAG: hypothetical protein Sapg2KO_13400 [Saprospiraceae bacterium]
MSTSIKSKKQEDHFIPNPAGQFSMTKSTEKLCEAHLRWRKSQKAKAYSITDEKRLSYWSKMCAAESF